MPTVHVRYTLNHGGHVLKEGILGVLGPALAVAVADHLTCEEGVTTAGEVAVYFHESSPFDVLPTQVMIEVEGNSYPSREANLPDRTDALGADIRQMLPMHIGFELRVFVDGSVWFVSLPASHGLGDQMEDPSDEVLD